MPSHITALVRHGDYHQLADGQVIGISRDYPCKKVFELT